MPIELTTQLIHASIADVLRKIDAKAEVFDNPTQQGSPYPAWYIVHRSPVERQREVGNRYMLVYQIDIWYMLQQNITRLFDKYTAIAEQLQEAIEYLPIYGHEGVLIHTYENMWSLEMNAMKYSITLRIRCAKNSLPEEKMQVYSLDVFLKEVLKVVTVRFANPRAEFSAELPNTIYTQKGSTVTLPTVTGTFVDSENNEWVPDRWSIGAFGSEYVVMNTVITELVFVEVPKPEESEEESNESTPDAP